MGMGQNIKNKVGHSESKGNRGSVDESFGSMQDSPEFVPFCLQLFSMRAPASPTITTCASPLVSLTKVLAK